MRGRKRRNQFSVSIICHLVIKKESPNEGTETKCLCQVIYTTLLNKKRIPE